MNSCWSTGRFLHVLRSPQLSRRLAARPKLLTGAFVRWSSKVPGEEETLKKRMMAATLWGGKVAKEIYAEVKADAAELIAKGWPPRLLAVVVGDSAPSAVYLQNIRKMAERNGIEFELLCLPESVSRMEFHAVLSQKNTDPRITGIIIQRPVPAHLDAREVQHAVHPLKDVEGMHPTSLGRVVYGDADLAPCTAKAAVRLLKETGLEFKGLNVTIVGASEVVGKPIAFLLMTQGATLTICNSRTRNLAMYTRMAEAVFVAVGKPRLLKSDMVKPGAAVIDVGINQLSDGSIVGDVDYENVWPVAGWTTPVPRGVGTVTTAMLMQNTVIAAKRQQAHYEAAYGPDHVATNIGLMTERKE